MSRILLMLPVVIALVLSGCKSSRESASTAKEGTEQTRPPEPGPGIPPGHCRVVAELVSLEECSAPPCGGTVRIKKIIGYGSAFNAPLSKDSEVRVSFLSSVKDLKAGSSFETDLASPSAQISGSQEKPAFSISRYAIQ